MSWTLPLITLAASAGLSWRSRSSPDARRARPVSPAGNGGRVAGEESRRRLARAPELAELLAVAPHAFACLAFKDVHVADEIGDEARSRRSRRSPAGVAICTNLPSFITADAAATVIASSWSCVTMMKVVPVVSWMCISSNCVCSRSLLVERAERLVEQQDLRLAWRCARASATRWRWPPESWCGLRLANVCICTSASISCVRVFDLGLGHAFLPQAEGDVVFHASCAETARRTGTSC